MAESDLPGKQRSATKSLLSTAHSLGILHGPSLYSKIAAHILILSAPPTTYMITNHNTKSTKSQHIHLSGEDYDRGPLYAIDSKSLNMYRFHQNQRRSCCASPCLSSSFPITLHSFALSETSDSSSLSTFSNFVI